MTREEHHMGGGCEFIERQDGSELSDYVVHIWYCPEAPKFIVYMPGHVLRACQRHADSVGRRPGVTVIPMNSTEQSHD